MAARLCNGNYNVVSHCPQCKMEGVFQTVHPVTVSRKVKHSNGATYPKILYTFCQCTGCFTAGLATIYEATDRSTAILAAFYPISIGTANVPGDVPNDILAEFREAETCAAHKLNRAASALFRSVLEKVLKTNGYIKSNDPSLKDLQKRIDAAAADGVITDARKKRAHEDVRALGNDVLHDDWREVTDDEVEQAHKYTQRILEDLYDDRSTVEGVLVAKGKLPPKTPSTGTPSPTPSTEGPPVTPTMMY